MDQAHRSVVVRVLHEISPDDVVGICDAFRLLRSRREKHAGVFDPAKREHIPVGAHVEFCLGERAAREGLDMSALLIEPNIGDISVRNHANALGFLEGPAIHTGKAGRRAVLVVAMFNRGACRQHGRTRSFGACFGVPLEGADLEGFARAGIPRQEIGIANRPPAVRYVVVSLEIPGHQRPAPSLPVPRGPAERTDAHRTHVPRVDPDHATVGETLCLRFASKPSAFKEYHRQTRCAEVQRQRHAGRSSARNADVGFERLLFQRMCVEKHRAVSVLPRARLCRHHRPEAAAYSGEARDCSTRGASHRVH